MIRRGDVFLARLSPTEGSEQQGTRPVVVVSRDAINQYSPVVVVVPLTDRAHKTKDRKSTRLNSSHIQKSRMPSSA